jgi:predicted dehydrogenase
MAIHLFDSARFVTGAEPLAVFCEEFQPPGSWFAGAPAALVVAEMTGGSRLLVQGNWCDVGRETSWDGRWNVSGERGTARWDGWSAPEVSNAGAPAALTAAPMPAQTATDLLSSTLTSFLDALRHGIPAWGDAANNLMSVAMLHAALRSARDGRRVAVAEVLGEARR